jgi:putative membrane protein
MELAGKVMKSIRNSRIATVLVATSAIAMLGVPVLAQRSATLNSSDQQYLTKAAQGSTYEFEIAELGAEKASSSTTQQYAQKLLNDHAQYNIKLLQLARQKGLTLPVTGDPSKQSMIDKLVPMSGPAFDQAFAQEMIRINSEDISESRKQLSATRDPAIKAFINQFVPGDQQHLEAARSIANHTAQNSEH